MYMKLNLPVLIKIEIFIAIFLTANSCTHNNYLIPTNIVRDSMTVVYSKEWFGLASGNGFEVFI